MKLKYFSVENFRCFKEKTQIDIDDLTVFVGRNDIGKSALLESLDIYFNEKDAIVKLDNDDVNVGSKKKEVILTAEFEEYPQELVIDTIAKTSLKTEFLVRINGRLAIQKKFANGKLKEVSLIADHPSNNELKDLMSLKIGDLKTRAKELNVEENLYDARVASSIREAIRQTLKSKIILTEQSIRIFTEKDENISAEFKEIWKQLQDYLPLYQLFQSDRKNEEKDTEIQDPMKFAIKRALEEQGLPEKLEEVHSAIRKAVTETGQRTLDKLKDMNPEIAKELTPEFSRPSWEKAFQFTLKSDDQIPLDKRGSGVRRLILLNFFRAEAERKVNERKTPNVIYALEEPETSLHPDYQKKLVAALTQLAKTKSDQIILTTHSPEIAKLFPPDSLVLLKKENEQVTFNRGTDNILREIAQALSVLPNLQLENISNVKLALCVEGKNDIYFLENICDSIPDLKALVDLRNDPRIIKLPMGGSSLQYWINNDYLGKLKLKQVHIYDSDVGSNSEHKYKKYVDTINTNGNGSIAFETKKRALENYFHPNLIKTKYGYEITNENWDTSDIPEEIAKQNLLASGSSTNWINLDEDNKNERKRKIKNQLNENHSKDISKDMLLKLSAYEEVKEWFQKMAELVS